MQNQPRTSARRRAAVALALVALATLLVASGTTGAAAAAAAGPAATAEFPPRWAVDVDDTTDDFQYGFAVDRLGNSYTASGTSLVRMVSPAGELVRTITALGTGTIEPRGLTVSDDLEVTVVGNISGTVTVGAPPHQATLTGTNPGAEFLIRFDRFGTVAWSRLFGEYAVGATTGDINIFQLHEQGDRLLLNAEYTATVTIDGITVTQPDDGGTVSGLLAGFDAATGMASWLTAIDVLDEEIEHPYVFPLDGATDADSFAIVSHAGGAVQIRSAGTTSEVACDDHPTSGCGSLIVVDPRTGNVTLARPLDQLGDSHGYENLALVDDGFVIANDRWDSGLQRSVGTFVQRLDASGDPVGTTEVTVGGRVSTSGLAVDGNGDIIVTGTFIGTTSLGFEAGAPTMTATGTSGAYVVELEGSGAIRRWTSAGGGPGVGASTYNPSLAIGPNDDILVTGTRTGPITFGSGPGAVALPGDGTYLASYPADRPPPGSTFHPITPTRLLDSRTATGGWNGTLAAGAPRELAVAGVLGIPAEATAVVLNLTATDVSTMTYLTAWPTGVPQPTASNLNVVAGDTIANHATVQVGAGGTITLATAEGSMNVIADLLGYYTPADSTPTGDGYRTMSPTRLLDSRTATGGWNAKLAAGTPRNLQVAGADGIPTDATAVVLSVTVTDTSDLTYLRVQPTGRTATSSNIAVNPGQTITNLVTTAVDTGGKVTFTNNRGTVNVVADAVGYYDHNGGGATFHPVSPTRILDSRNGTGGPAAAWGPGTTRAITTSAVAPAGTIVAVAANLTATDTTAMSYLTLFAGPTRPGTSNLLFTPGQTIASAATTGVAADGTVSLYNQLGSTHLILDIDGYFTNP